MKLESIIKKIVPLIHAGIYKGIDRKIFEVKNSEEHVNVYHMILFYIPRNSLIRMRDNLFLGIKENVT